MADRSGARRIIAAVSCLVFMASAGRVFAQGDAMRTTAEKSNYRETTRYADVLRIMDAASRAAPDLIRIDTFGYTFEGRAMPLAVVGHVTDKRPETVRASGKTVVYVQGNIHAGEVEGKESLLVLLRELSAGQHREWLDSLVLLIAPIYNSDGNERVEMNHRGVQNGPIAGMGQRPNAQDYDLNRDHMKLDAPEARALVGLFTRYDPQVIMDLHTTDGTRHAYYITYSIPMHPSTDSSIVRLMRTRWMPEVTRTIKQKHGWDYYYYGNLQGQGEDRGWYTFDYRAMFNNNYAGLRNRFGILSEAYAYATFEDRIKATSWFVEEVLNFAMRNATQIRRETARADAESLVGKRLALRADFEKAAQPVTILMGEVEEIRNPLSGARMLNRLDVSTPERMAEFGTFRPTDTERVPRSYLVPASLTDVIDKLSTHGVKMTTLSSARSVRVEKFRIDSTTVGREFQGHTERTLYGAYEVTTESVPAGTVVVSTEQPLGRLIFSLLEPRSDDGFLDWNVLDRDMGMATATAGRGGFGGGGRGGRGGGQAAPQQRATHYPIMRTDEVLR
jgi:Zinc carboxypeptidase